MPLVTIAISIYNAEKYVVDAVRSVLNQTFSDFELLLIDDGSTDDSIPILREIKDDRIKIISDGENRGLVYRLNQSVEIASGKYYARMDADDIMHPKRLEKQIEYLKTNPRVDVVGTWAYSINVNNEIQGVLKNSISLTTLEDVIAHQCFIHPTIMGKTTWFKLNPYDSKYIRIEDMELWSRTIQHSVFANIGEPLFFYREVGIPYLNKYLLSMKGERKIINKYYRGKLNGIKLLLRNYLKSFCYIIFTLFHVQHVLLRLRSCNIPADEVELGSKMLNQAVRK